MFITLCTRILSFYKYLSLDKSNKKKQLFLNNSCEIKKNNLSLHRKRETNSSLKPFKITNAKIAQLVEHDLAKVGVAGSSPVFRSSRLSMTDARVVELVDTQDLKSCDHCDRAGSIPASSTILDTSNKLIA